MATETNQLRTILTLQDNMSAKLGAIEARLKGLGTTAGVAGRTGAMAAEQWGSKLKTLGGNLRMLGMTMTTYVTAPLVGLGYVAVKTAMEMESKWAEVRKVYDGAASDIKNLLEPAVNKLSVSLGFQRTQTMDALAAIAAMGYKGKPAIDMLTQSMKFARLGNMELGQSMEAVVAVSKIYNVSGKNLTKMLAVMNETENVSAASMDDLTWGIKEAASVGRLAGVDIRELSAMMAVLRERAISAGEAAFSLKSIFTRLRNPTKDAKVILDEFNIAITDTKGRVMDADQILLKIAGSWDKMTERQQESLATELVGIHQKGRFISLIDDMTRKNSTYNQVLKKTADETTNVSHYQRELNIFLEQAKVKWEAIKTQLGIVAEKIGKDLLPVVLKFAQVAADLATKFGNLPAPIRRTSLVILGLAAIIGPIIMVLGSLISSLGSLALTLPYVAKGFKLVTLASKATWAALSAHPFVLVIAAMAAGYKMTDYLSKRFGELGRVIGFVLGAGGVLYNTVFQFRKVISNFRNLDNAIQRDMGVWRGWGVALGDTVRNAKDRVITQIGRIVSYLRNVAKKMYSIGSNIGSSLYNGLANWLNKIFNAFARVFGQASRVRGLKKPVEAGVPSRQHGGLIPGSTFEPVPIIAHGQERIISHTGADMAKGGDVNINFNGSISIRKDSDITAIADAVAKALGRRTTLASYGAF